MITVGSRLASLSERVARVEGSRRVPRARMRVCSREIGVVVQDLDLVGVGLLGLDGGFDQALIQLKRFQRHLPSTGRPSIGRRCDM